MSAPTPKPTTKRAPRTPRIKADRHKDDLRILSTTTPDKLAQAVVKGFGFQHAQKP